MATTVVDIHEFDYVVVGCGYTHRLVKHLSDIRNKIYEHITSGECNHVKHPEHPKLSEKTPRLIRGGVYGEMERDVKREKLEGLDAEDESEDDFEGSDAEDDGFPKDADEDMCRQCFKRNVVYIHSDSGFCKCGNMKHHLIQCGDAEDFEAVTSILNKDQVWGSICFKAGELSEAFEIVNVLTDYRHCACFGQIPYKMQFVTGPYKDKTVKILVMDYDTESG